MRILISLTYIIISIFGFSQPDGSFAYIKIEIDDPNGLYFSIIDNKVSYCIISNDSLIDEHYRIRAAIIPINDTIYKYVNNGEEQVLAYYEDSIIVNNIVYYRKTGSNKSNKPFLKNRWKLSRKTQKYVLHGKCSRISYENCYSSTKFKNGDKHGKYFYQSANDNYCIKGRFYLNSRSGKWVIMDRYKKQFILFKNDTTVHQKFRTKNFYKRKRSS